MVLSRDRLPRAVLVDLARSRRDRVSRACRFFTRRFAKWKTSRRCTKLRLCISAGAPLTASLAKNFHDKFRQPIHSFYGSSECGGICYDRDGTSFDDGFVGTPMNDVDLEFIEPRRGIEPGPRSKCGRRRRLFP